jgi:hypothetical protein
MDNIREFIKFLKDKNIYIGKFFREFDNEAEFESLLDNELEELIIAFKKEVKK